MNEGGEIGEFIAAWLRLLLTLYIVICLPWLPFVLSGGFDPSVTPFLVAVVLASPLVFFRDSIMRRDPPYLGPGWWIVAVYGPGLWLVVILWPYQQSPMPVGEALLLLPLVILIYEVVVFLIAAVYLGLWILGDRYLRATPMKPRQLVRLSVTVALLAASAVYTTHACRVLAQDACLDSGGRVLADRSCYGARPAG